MPETAGIADRWQRLTDRTLTGLEVCDPVYRPTNFWQPGVRQLLDDMQRLGLESFKSWPSAYFWFYPTYGANVTWPTAQQYAKLLREHGSDAALQRLRRLLLGFPEAMRDFDAARLTWDHGRWPADLDAFGESDVGAPRFRYPLAGDSQFGKPYLNYLQCMAALSRHVDAPPRSVLELGGGFGVLGELLLSRDPTVRYVNLDIPLLLTVASYYLTELFGDERVLTFDESVADAGPIADHRSACLPNWRIRDLDCGFEVFINSFSFQEMEPAVVEEYVDAVAALEVGYVVSLNTREGKKLAEDSPIGVLERTTSATIIASFERRGYELCGRYNRPYVAGSGELAVLRRR